MPFAGYPANYPRPRLSMLPSRSRFTRPRGAAFQPSSAFLGQADFFVYGRYALVEALARAGVGPGTAVLLPAYHCRSVVESALYRGAEVRLYDVTAKLQPDFDSVRALAADGKASAMLLTHYFGFPNALAESRRFCTERGIALIEDCAHAFYGRADGQTLGTVGDFAISSAWKFLPLRDGAMFLDNTQPRAGSRPNVHGESPPRIMKRRPAEWRREIRAMAGAVKAWLTRSPGKPAFPAMDFVDLAARARDIAGRPLPEKQLDDAQFDSRQVDAAGLRVSRWLTAHAPHHRVAERRRANYGRWLSGVARIPGAEALFPALPEGVVPYAFPLLTDAGGLAFHALKLAGIPIWRWEDVAMTTCAVSRGYRLRLLQLPCHQDLTDEEIDWMIDTLRGVMPHLLGSERA
ncbi:MAG: DegT/DnrJ/EryC1/StrS family aminotransferase [Sulfuricella sp.]|nr:DegT/DnrJ/EryC1/StrS family aminotransferase [Sulfuricella sp.]